MSAPDDVLTAAESVKRAVEDFGPHPGLHTMWLVKLRLENPTMARALCDLIHAMGGEPPYQLRR